MSATPELDGFLSSLLKESKIPNIYDYIIPDDFSAATMPDRFTKSSHKYPLFLDIFGHILTVKLAIIFALFIALSLAKTCRGKIQTLGQKVVDTFVWNGLIRSTLESSIYVFLGALLNLKYGNDFSDGNVMTNYVLSIIAMSFMMWFGVYCVILVVKQNRKFDRTAFARFKELVADIRPNASDFAFCFSGIFLLRRLLLVAVVVFLENPKYQVSLMFLVNLAHLAWMLVDKPFDNGFMNFVEIYADFIVTLLNGSMFIFIS